MGKARAYIYCTDLENSGCCGSCHSEWDDYGEPFEDEFSERVTYMRCCAARQPTRDEVAKILRDRRKSK